MMHKSFLLATAQFFVLVQIAQLIMIVSSTIGMEPSTFVVKYKYCKINTGTNILLVEIYLSTSGCTCTFEST